MQVHDIELIRKGDGKVRNGGADVPDHDADDQQPGHVIHLLGKQEDHPYDEQGAHKGRQDHMHGGDLEGQAGAEDHHQTHHQLGAGGNAQHEGTGDGVAEEGLDQETGHRQSPAQDGGQEHPGDADAEDDLAVAVCVDHCVKGFCIFAAGEQIGDPVADGLEHHSEDVPHRDLHGAGVDVQHQAP